MFLQEAVAEHASGSYVTTSDGRKHLDVSGGVGRVCVYVLFFCFCWGGEGGVTLGCLMGLLLAPQPLWPR